jgi:protein phosphatase
MISQCPAFNHLDLPNAPIPSPRVYQLDFPVGLDHVLEQAMHPNLERRFANVPEFMNSLERALQEIEERHRQPLLPLQLNVGHDIHIGINKGLRNPVNQDALFWRYDREHNKGMFLIADGVSHCHYGSGDRASSILIQAARQTWDALSESPLMEQHLDYKQRRGVLNSVFAAANRAIASEVNELYDRVEGYVEDVMGSTCVGGFIDANQITVTNLGDSRAYLKTAHYIEQISVDHDYKTAQLQIGQDLRSLQNLMGGSLITRCVGSCRKDEQLKVVPLQLQADFFDLALIPGDTIVFCSDGLSDYAGETEEEARDMISKIIDVHTEPISACFWMVALANQRGGGDNISVIEIKVLDHA